MFYRFAADALLIVHLAFIAFVVLGGVLAIWRHWVPFVHLPAAFWGAFVELDNRVCPLTIWENGLRHLAGDAGYATSFVDHYLLPVIYPAGLTRGLQLGLATLVVLINVAMYAWVFYGRRAAKAR
ncbi:MAG: DUF2784 domain-containing protein [Gammaproteobacteria bacterium]|nr:DUF2784 domain-containing protein [Gammaproteobacteria bacterium]